MRAIFLLLRNAQKSVFLICPNRLRVAHLLRENDCFALFEISKSNFVKMEKNTIFFDF